MSLQKQVDKAHYNFTSYIDEYRWASLWHQITEVENLKPDKVLEIGPGPGIFKNISRLIGINVETIDLDPDLNPDHLGSATSLPFADASYDVVCAFQMLEHLPYQESLIALKEMVRVARRSVVISLPDAKSVFRWRVYIPGIAAFDRLFPRFGWSPVEHVFDGEHHWEINKKGYTLKKVLLDFSCLSKIERTYRVLDNPYHRFFVFSK